MQRMEAVHSAVLRTVLRMKEEKMDQQDKHIKVEQNPDQAAAQEGETRDKRRREEDQNRAAATGERTMLQSERGVVVKEKVMEGKKEPVPE